MVIVAVPVTVAPSSGDENDTTSAGAAVIVKVWALETRRSGLRTLTAADPAAATSAPVMLAVRRLALTKVVVRGAPFQSTVAPATKLPPSTVSVNGGPASIVELGVSAVVTGALEPPVTEKFSRVEACPEPGRTSTGNVPATTRSDAGMSAVTRVEPTKRVTRNAPCQYTAASPSTKFVPSTVRLKPELPAAAVFGVSAVSVGAGLGLGAIRNTMAFGAWTSGVRTLT